jgi:hypothetical protein
MTSIRVFRTTAILPLLALSMLALTGPLSPLRAEEALRLQERFTPGAQYHVSTRVDLSGTLQLPAEKGKSAPKPLTMNGTSAIEYDERLLAADKEGPVEKSIRLYRRMDFQRTVGERRQENSLRPAVRRLVLLRQNDKKAPFSPDGPLLWGEIDLVRTDVFAPALAGLLPGNAVSPGDRWKAATAAVQELTDLEKIDEGQLECKLEQVTTLEKRRHARVALTGTVRGPSEDGTSRHQLEGYFYFDLESNHLSYLYLKGVQSLLDKEGNEVGRIEGRFVLTRQANSRCPDLSDEALKGVAVEPNADNTLLLYDNPDLGVKFLYPRRWRVASVRGPQVTLDSADGSGLVLTVEPLSRVPTGAQFLTESRDWLQGQKAKLLRTEPPQEVQANPKLEHFSLQAEVGGDKVLLDYYVTRHAGGGATLAARLLPAELPALQGEVERLARSVVITRKIEERK